MHKTFTMKTRRNNGCTRVPFRRAFVLVSGLALLFSAGSAEAQQPKRPIGIQTQSVQDEMRKDPVATLEQLGRMGYAFVETWAGYKDRQFYGMTPAAFRAVLDKNKMKMLGALERPPVPASTDRNQAVSWWDDCIADNVAAGATLIGTIGIDKASMTSLDSLKAFADYLNVVGAKAKAAGLQFAYHNSPGDHETVQGEVAYDYVVKNTDPSLVFFELDTWMTFRGGKDSVDYLKRYPNRFALLHLQSEAVFSASVKVDFPPILEAANAIGVKYYIVDDESKSVPSLEGAKKNIDYVNASPFMNK